MVRSRSREECHRSRSSGRSRERQNVRNHSISEERAKRIREHKDDESRDVNRSRNTEGSKDVSRRQDKGRSMDMHKGRETERSKYMRTGGKKSTDGVKLDTKEKKPKRKYSSSSSSDETGKIEKKNLLKTKKKEQSKRTRDSDSESSSKQRHHKKKKSRCSSDSSDFEETTEQELFRKKKQLEEQLQIEDEIRQRSETLEKERDAVRLKKLKALESQFNVVVQTIGKDEKKGEKKDRDKDGRCEKKQEKRLDIGSRKVENTDKENEKRCVQQSENEMIVSEQYKSKETIKQNEKKTDKGSGSGGSEKKRVMESGSEKNRDKEGGSEKNRDKEGGSEKNRDKEGGNEKIRDQESGSEKWSHSKKKQDKQYKVEKKRDPESDSEAGQAGADAEEREVIRLKKLVSLESQIHVVEKSMENKVVSEKVDKIGSERGRSILSSEKKEMNIGQSKEESPDRKDNYHRRHTERDQRRKEEIGSRYWGDDNPAETSKVLASKSSDTYWNKYADKLGIQIDDSENISDIKIDRRERGGMDAYVRGDRDSRGGREQRDRDGKDRSDRVGRNRGKNSSEHDPNLNREADASPPKKLVTDLIKKPVVDPLSTRAGGAYIPPAKLKMMQAQITDKSSAEFQRLSWEALKKSINGLVNKINVSNIGVIVRELFRENIVRGRGILCRALMQAQQFSPTFTPVYAALVAVINTKFPQIGELLLKRLVIQVRRGVRRNDKTVCMASSRFVAHLINQQVAHEVVALEILTFLLERARDTHDDSEGADKSRDDSVELAIAFLKECGSKLMEVSPKGVTIVFETLRHILHEGKLEQRVKYMIEVMMAIRKDGFKDHPTIPDNLDLVEEDEQFTHMVELDGKFDGQEILNVFQMDQNYEENEEKYREIRSGILGDSSDEGGDSGADGSGESDSEDSDDEEEDGPTSEKKEGAILDQTETNMVAFRRTVYLTIQSSLDVDECAHKLLKAEIKPGWEMELCNMILDCCAQQRTYIKFYGLLAQRFCQLNRIYQDHFQQIFHDAYDTCHRLETEKLRNVARLFSHLLFSDAISWEVFMHVHLNEDETTSSSRVFLKILFQELAQFMSVARLLERLRDPTLSAAFDGLMPRDNPNNTRFSINFFTSIGLGSLTDDLREFLRTQPKPTAVVAPVQQQQVSSGSSSSSDSSSSSESSSSGSSDSSSDSSSSSSSSESSSSDSDDASSNSESEIEYKKNKKKKKNMKQGKKEEEMSKHKRNKNTHKESRLKSSKVTEGHRKDRKMQEGKNMEKKQENERTTSEINIDKVSLHEQSGNNSRQDREREKNRKGSKLEREKKQDHPILAATKETESGSSPSRRDRGDRPQKEIGDRQERSQREEHLSEQERDSQNKEKKSRSDRAERSRIEREERSRGEREERSRGEREEKSRGEKAQKSHGEREERSQREKSASKLELDDCRDRSHRLERKHRVETHKSSSLDRHRSGEHDRSHREDSELKGNDGHQRRDSRMKSVSPPSRDDRRRDHHRS